MTSAGIRAGTSGAAPAKVRRPSLAAARPLVRHNLAFVGAIARKPSTRASGRLRLRRALVDELAGVLDEERGDLRVRLRPLPQTARLLQASGARLSSATFCWASATF